METKKIKFVCPECGSTELAMAQEAHETVSVIEVDGAEGEQWFVPGEVVESDVVDVFDYGCADCDFSIGTSAEQAIKWLAEHGMIAGG
jgi:hypothetical protein